MAHCIVFDSTSFGLRTCVSFPPQLSNRLRQDAAHHHTFEALFCVWHLWRRVSLTVSCNSTEAVALQGGNPSCWCADADSITSDPQLEAASHFTGMYSKPMEGADSLRSSLDGAVQLSTDMRESQTAAEAVPSITRRTSLRMSADGNVCAAASQHSSLRGSSDGGHSGPPAWRASMHDSLLPGHSSRSSVHNSVDGLPQSQHGADAGTLMHRLSNLSSAFRSDDLEHMDEVDEELSGSPSSSGSEGYRDKAGDGHDNLLSPTNHFSDFSFKNYGLLAQHNMEALQAEVVEAHAEKAHSTSSAERPSIDSAKHNQLEG